MEKLELDEMAPPPHYLQRYRKSCHWLKNEDFLRQLEHDTVDTEILDQEIETINKQENKHIRGRILRVLDSNPFQILLFVLVMADAAIVIAEILLDLHSIRGQLVETEYTMSVASEYLRLSYPHTFSEHPEVDNLEAVLIILLNSEEGHNLTSAHHDQGHGEDEHHEGQGNHQDKGHHQDDLHQSDENDTGQKDHHDIDQSHTNDDENDQGHVGDESSHEADGGRHRRSSGGGGTDNGQHSDLGHHTSHTSHEIAHILHFCSIAILAFFVFQVILRMYGMGLEFFHEKLEVFDAVIISASFALDLVFINGIGGSSGEEAAILLIVFLLWRILRVINGLMVTEKKRQEFRMKLQIGAREKAEKSADEARVQRDQKQKELDCLKELCKERGITQEEITECTNKMKQKESKSKTGTSAGLSSIAALSLGLSISLRQSLKKFGSSTNVYRVRTPDAASPISPLLLQRRPTNTNSQRHVGFSDDAPVKQIRRMSSVPNLAWLEGAGGRRGALTGELGGELGAELAGIGSVNSLTGRRLSYSTISLVTLPLTIDEDDRTDNNIDFSCDETGSDNNNNLGDNEEKIKNCEMIPIITINDEEIAVNQGSTEDNSSETLPLICLNHDLVGDNTRSNEIERQVLINIEDDENDNDECETQPLLSQNHASHDSLTRDNLPRSCDASSGSGDNLQNMQNSFISSSSSFDALAERYKDLEDVVLKIE